MQKSKAGRKIQVILSEVTDIGDEYVCIAGWSDELERMVRPLCDAQASHWPVALAENRLLVVGNVLEMKILGTSSHRSMPHALDDTPVEKSIRVFGLILGRELKKRLGRSVAPTVHRVFAERLVGERYVVEGERCPSLGAVEIDPRRMGFEENDGKPRCWFYDQSNTAYNLSLRSRELRDLARSKGIEALEERRKPSRCAHVRLGLAEGWRGKEEDFEPPRCYAQVNGIIFE